MSSDERLKDLGLLHLQHKPKELAAAIEKRLQTYEDRRKAAKKGASCHGVGRRKAS
jgi:hypothetical protein